MIFNSVISSFQTFRLFATQFRLTMSSVDIGNYLDLAVDAVSRTLTKLQKHGVIKVKGKEVVIVDMIGLSCLNGTNQEQSKALHLR